jgi:membrane-anchored mycosin MYCP
MRPGPGPGALLACAGLLAVAAFGPAPSGPAPGATPVGPVPIAPAGSAGVPLAATGLTPAPPIPPPVRTDPPAGRRPGAAAGLEAPGRCTPPPADGVPAGGVPASLRPAEIHGLATGAGQVVAVIDTGVARHPLLAGRLVGGGDYLTGGDGLLDCDGHGTAVAGLLAAAPERSPTGARTAVSVGIAPGAQVLSIRQSSPSHSVPGANGSLRPAGDTDTLAEAVVLAVRRGADVINISEAVCLLPERAAAAGARLQSALRYAAQSDVVVVAAAGNAGSGSCTTDGSGQVSLPGWYGDDVLTVGAVEPDGRPAAFTVPGPWVDVAAPGTGLRSLAVGGGTTAEGITGTSFAAPWVAGLAALIRERFPELTAREVVDRILATARRTPDARGALGHGIIDPLSALTAVPAQLAPAELAQAPAPIADLPGTAPHPDPPPASLWPVDLVAGVMLLAASVATAVLLQQRPRRRTDSRGRRLRRPGR